MKQSFSLALVFMLVAALLIPVVQADDSPTDSGYLSIEYLDNGDYIITEYAQDLSRGLSPNSIMATKPGTKTATYYNSAGTRIWSVTVDGTFSYTYGVSATATGATATVNIYAAGATFVSKSASTTGNTATATGTVRYNGVTTSKSVSVSCDKYGNIY